MAGHRFGLTSEDCELLVLFEETGSLPALSRRLGRDVSVLSRQLKSIAEQAPVIEKIHHRWRLSELGRSLNRWTLDASTRQQELLGQRPTVRLGATRTFTCRVLAPEIVALGRILPECRLHLLAFEPPLEGPLLAGKVDIALACGKPADPLVAYRLLLRERYTAVIAKTLAEKHGPKSEADLFGIPHLALRDSRGRYPFRDVVARCREIVAVMNDPMSLLAAVGAGAGWTILPDYAVRDGIVAGTLVGLPLAVDLDQRYGIWWLRDRTLLKSSVDRLARWVSGLDL
jgi:DNA-binding transcriptional LysR family regulator